MALTFTSQLRPTVALSTWQVVTGSIASSMDLQSQMNLPPSPLPGCSVCFFEHKKLIETVCVVSCFKLPDMKGEVERVNVKFT